MAEKIEKAPIGKDVDIIENDIGDSTIREMVYSLREEIARNRGIEKIIRLESDVLELPSRISSEHRRIAELSRTPWAQKVVNSRVQRLNVSGIRSNGSSDEELWNTWKRRWKMASKERTIYREALTYGSSYVELRKNGLTTTPILKSPFLFTAFYEEDGFGDFFNAEHPTYAIELSYDGKSIKVWDNRYIVLYNFDPARSAWIEQEKYLHGANHVPIVRYASDISSSGESFGEIYPLRHLLTRITKTTYDSALINHNNSFAIRYATGLSGVQDLPRIEGETDEEYSARQAMVESYFRMELTHSTMLTSSDPDTKFGQLAATNPSSFVPVIESMLRELSAVSNTPSEYLTGETIPQSAEQAANSNASYKAIIREKQDLFGASHEQLLSLHAEMVGKSLDSFPEIVWSQGDDTSIAAITDALVKQKSIGVPERVLWKELPNMTPEKYTWLIEEAEKQENREKEAISRLTAMGAYEENSDMPITTEDAGE